MIDYIYDLETYPNVFTAVFRHTGFPCHWVFEISEFKNDSEKLIEFLKERIENNDRLVGFNNVRFDYPILHSFLKGHGRDPHSLYRKAQAIIDSEDNEHRIWDRDMLIPQIDLMMVHHYDNKARATSLKKLEFNMRSEVIQELPYAPGTNLTQDQIKELIIYNKRDVDETYKFYTHSLSQIKFREQWGAKCNRNFMNHNDAKIGEEYFIMELEKAGVECYTREETTDDLGRRLGNRKKPRQTPRQSINLADVILPDVNFKNPRFNKVVDFFKSQVITETKGVFKDLTALVGGIEFVFGAGGIHASVENRIFKSDEDKMIVDLDVSSYYPNLAIANGFYPEHLGPRFCEVYKKLYDYRKSFPKGSPENAGLKISLNGSYGKSNSQYSVFYDPMYTMKTTINGQLYLCMLAEAMLEIEGLELIQVNTDGIAVILPRDKHQELMWVKESWEMMVNLQLEETRYSAMYVANVNSYIAVEEDGTIKRKKDYNFELDWHQDASMLVVPKVACEVMVHGAPIRETVENWPDIMDFMLRTNVPRSSYLQSDSREEPLQRVTRYYVSKGGERLTKWMSPLKKNPEKWRPIVVSGGRTVTVCNDMKEATREIDYDFYIEEVEKICLGLS